MSVNRQVIEAASWRLVCELFRRYPDRFVLIQTHPGGGVYDCLALLNRDHKEVAGFNRDGSMRVCDPPGEVDPTKTYSDIWRQVVEADDLKTVVDRIAATLRLPRVHHLPKGTPEVIVYRLIADFLAHTVFGRVEWRCLNGFEDTSGVGGGVRTKWFDRFPLAKDGLRERRKDDVLGEPAYRFWFICRAMIRYCASTRLVRRGRSTARKWICPRCMRSTNASGRLCGSSRGNISRRGDTPPVPQPPLKRNEHGRG